MKNVVGRVNVKTVKAQNINKALKPAGDETATNFLPKFVKNVDSRWFFGHYPGFANVQWLIAVWKNLVKCKIEIMEIRFKFFY